MNEAKYPFYVGIPIFILLSLSSFSLMNILPTHAQFYVDNSDSTHGEKYTLVSSSGLDKLKEIFNDTSNNNSNTNTVDSESSDTQGANIVLLSQKLKKDDGSYNYIVGQVKNIGNNTAEFVKIGLTTFDVNGDVIGTDYAYATADTLKSNQKSSFELTSSKDDFQGMKNYELFLQWNNPDGTEEYIENAQIYKDNSTKPIP